MLDVFLINFGNRLISFDLIFPEQIQSDSWIKLI